MLYETIAACIERNVVAGCQTVLATSGAGVQYDLRESTREVRLF